MRQDIPKPARVKCHTSVEDAFDLLSGDSRDEFNFFLSKLPNSGSDTADGFRRRLGTLIKRANDRGSAATPDTTEPLLKASKQLDEQIDTLLFPEGGGRALPPPLNLTDLAQFLSQNVWHNRCVQLIARLASGPEWGLVPSREDLRPAEADEGEHETLEAFFERANPRGQDISDVMECVLTDLVALGNGYLEVVRDEQGRPAELHHVPAVSVRLDKRMENGHTVGFWQVGRFGHHGAFAGRFFKWFGDARVWDNEKGEPAAGIPEARRASELIHLATYHPLSRHYGIPRWLAALLSMRTDWANLSWNADFFEHNLLPNQIIVFKGLVPDDETVEEIQDYFTSGAKGRSHKALILSVEDLDENQGIDVTQLQNPASQEAGFLKLREANRDEVVAAHGVPPRMVGIQRAGALGGKGDAETARRDFKLFVIEPLQELAERTLNRGIVEDGFSVEDWLLKLADFDLSDHEFALLKAKEMRAAVGVGILTINEARIAMGRAPLDPGQWPGADEPFIQTSAGPAFLRAMDPEQPGAQGPAAQGGLVPAAPNPDTVRDEDKQDEQDQRVEAAVEAALRARGL